MHIFILGGNSIHNKLWAHQLASALRHLADNTEVHEYAHWKNGQDLIDLEVELAALAKKLPTTEDYAFVAKSMGTVLAAKGMHTGQFAPKACFFMGIPLRVITESSIPFASWLHQARCTITFAQNSADPLGSYADVRQYLADNDLADHDIKELGGDTHDYLAMPELIRITAHILRK